MYPILRPLLNKGGAGRSATRAETAEMLNPAVRRHIELIAAYEVALRDLRDRGLAERLNDGMNRLRTELAKLKSTVLALGGTPPNGTDLDPEDLTLGATDAEIVHALADAERGYGRALADVLDYPHHQIRTIAILENNRAGSAGRMGVLGPLADRLPRPAERPLVPPAAPTAAPEDPVTGQPADLHIPERHAGPGEQPAIS